MNSFWKGIHMAIIGILTCEILELEFANLYSEPFNEQFAFRTDVCEGSLGLLQKTWESAKAFVNFKTD